MGQQYSHLTCTDRSLIRMTLTQNKTNGSYSSDTNSFKVSLKMKKLKLVAKLGLVNEVDFSILDKTSKKDTSSTSAETRDPQVDWFGLGFASLQASVFGGIDVPNAPSAE